MRNFFGKSEILFGSNGKFLGPDSRPPRSQNGLTSLLHPLKQDTSLFVQTCCVVVLMSFELLNEREVVTFNGRVFSGRVTIAKRCQKNYIDETNILCLWLNWKGDGSGHQPGHCYQKEQQGRTELSVKLQQPLAIFFQILVHLINPIGMQEVLFKAKWWQDRNIRLNPMWTNGL